MDRPNTLIEDKPMPNEQVDATATMLRNISNATTPTEVVSQFARAYWREQNMDLVVSVMTRDLPAGSYRVFRIIDVPALLRGEQVLRDPREDPSIHVTHTGGLIGELIDTQKPRVIDNLPGSSDPVLGEIVRDMKCCMSIPLYHDGEIGYWTFMFRRAPNAFTSKQLVDSMIIGNMMGGSTSKLLFIEKIRSLNEALEHQFDQVARVQESLLPQTLPRVDGLDFATYAKPCEQAGGDFYDFFPIDDHRVGVLLGDVSGHGPGAATVMALIHGALLGARPDPTKPAEFLSTLNALLCNSRLDQRFATAISVLLDTTTGRVELATFGHHPPLIRRTDGSVDELAGEGSPPLGVADDVPAFTIVGHLHPGDTLLLFTDGVVEAMNHARELFTSARLRDAIRQAPNEPACRAESLLTHIRRSVEDHADGHPPDDDITMIGIAVEPHT